MKILFSVPSRPSFFEKFSEKIRKTINLLVLKSGIFHTFSTLCKTFGGSLIRIHQNCSLPLVKKDLRMTIGALLTVCPASVSSERAFSISGSIFVRRRAGVKD